MLGQYMSSVGYGAYKMNGLGEFGSVPAPLLNLLFTPEKIEEGEFAGAKLSRGFTIQKEGANYVIVPKGAAELSAIATQVSGSGVVGTILGAVTNLAGELTNVRVIIPDIKQKFVHQTDIGGTLVYEPAGLNIYLIAGIAALLLVIGLYVMSRKK